MSQHKQMQELILAAGFVPGHTTTQVQYYVRGTEKVQLFHPGLWKRTPDRIALVTSFALPGVPARPDKWTQFDASNATAMAAFKAHLSPAPIAVVPAQPIEKANPLLAELSDEELDVYAPLS